MLVGHARYQEVNVFAGVGKGVEHQDRQLLKELLGWDSDLGIFKPTQLNENLEQVTVDEQLHQRDQIAVEQVGYAKFV